MENIIIGTVFILLTLVCGIISIFQFLQKGILLNNEYIYASPEKRKIMDKKPYFVQSGIVFALLGGAFLFFGLNFMLGIDWLCAVATVLLVLTLAYAIVSSIRSSK